jgi:hypothetical protein
MPTERSKIFHGGERERPKEVAPGRQPFCDGGRLSTMKHAIPTNPPRRPLAEEITGLRKLASDRRIASWNSFRKRHLKRPAHIVPTPELVVEDAVVKTPTVTGVANDGLGA